MREQLMRYIDLLFAGTPQCADIKQEILQNTLDHYDDLIAQGKRPEAAYSLAIAGIGDISELLSNGEVPPSAPNVTVQKREAAGHKAIAAVLYAFSIILYIVCPIPLFILQDEIGLCGLLGCVAVATALMVIQKQLRGEEPQKAVQAEARKSRTQKSVDSALWCVITVLYFILSFLTNAWHITWVMFLIGAAVQGVVNAIFDLKEA